MIHEALRRSALSLPEAHEAPHFERTSFRTGKKIFATMTRDGREAMVKLSSSADAEDLHIESALRACGRRYGPRRVSLEPGMERRFPCGALPLLRLRRGDPAKSRLT